MKKDLSLILIRPRITEKAARASEKSVYVFDIAKDATKSQVARAFAAKYKKTPVKVTTVTVSARATFVRGKRGTQAGYKKAYVYLKKGESIEVM